MGEKELMMYCITVANTICIAFILGKIANIEKNKNNTLYDLVYRIAYIATGLALGTAMALMIKLV